MQNAMAVTLILQCLTPDDNNKVQGMENAKRIWDTLKVSFEGDKSVRRGQIELLTSKIENFGWIEGDTTQVMFDKLMTLINKIRALGDTHWDDHAIARKLCRVYRQKNNILASVIMERENYDTMTPHEMLVKLKHHEILEDEAIEASARKKSIALTASQASGSSHYNKETCKHESNDSDEKLDDEQALLVRNYNKYLRMKKDKMRRNGGKPYKKRFCYECGDTDHFAADYPNKGKKSRYNEEGDKKYKNKKKGEAHLSQEWQSDDDSEDDNDNGNEKKSVAAIAIHETS
jgi:hypothetical protein